MKRRSLIKLLGASTLVPTVSMGSSTSKRLLVIYSHGGWDVSMLFDPKFDSTHVETASDGQLTSAGGIPYVASNNRPNVSEFMSLYAGQTCFINGIGVGSISHKKCEQVLFTGSRVPNSPDFASILASHHTDKALPYSILSGPRITGDLGLNVSRVDSAFVSILQQEPRVDYDKIYARLQSRASSQSSPHVTEYWSTLERQQWLRQHLDLFPENMDDNPNTQLSVALSLLAKDVSVVSMVQIAPPIFYQWDSHDGNDQMQSACYENLFQYLLLVAAQLESTMDLTGQPLSHSTTVVVLSEMGRTPVYNLNLGKDHWPYTSMMMFGNGIQGGQVFGASDNKLTSKAVSLQDGRPSAQGVQLTSGHVVAGLLQYFDIDSAHYVDSHPFLAPFQTS